MHLVAKKARKLKTPAASRSATKIPDLKILLTKNLAPGGSRAQVEAVPPPLSRCRHGGGHLCAREGQPSFRFLFGFLPGVLACGIAHSQM